MIEICYCIDRNTETCGYVSLYSLLTNASEKVSVLICYDREERIPGVDWGTKLSSFGFEFDIRYQGIDNSIFKQCRPAYGSHAPYLLLSAGLYAITPRLLCIDADTIVDDDISFLYHIDMEGKEIGLAQCEICDNANENEKTVLYKNHKEKTDPYYGSNIVLIDSKKFKESNRIERFTRTALSDPYLQMLWDQTVINCSYNTDEIINLKDLTESWNQNAPRIGPVSSFHKGMIHFVGTPKPWDLLGEIFHPGYKFWRRYASESGANVNSLRNYLSCASLNRAYKARRQYSVWLDSVWQSRFNKENHL